MIVGIGIDTVEIARFESELSKAAWSLGEGVFTPKEVADCSVRKNAAQRYAECFAAKEAALKALGVDISDMGLFREAEVQYRSSHECLLTLHGRLKTGFQKLGCRNIHLSVGHTSQHTIAVVILEG